MISIQSIFFCTAVVLLAGQQAASFPLPPAEVRLLNEKSGHYVSVEPDYSVTASASTSNPATKFQPSYPSSGSIRFESSHYPGRYIIIENGVLKAGTASNGNDVFDTLAVQHASELAFRQGTDCFIAFDSNGAAHGPCGLTTDDFETHFTKLSV